MVSSGVALNLRVVTVTHLSRVRGLSIRKSFLDARRPGAEGVVTGQLPCADGVVWLVQHDNGTVAAYASTDFNPVSKMP